MRKSRKGLYISIMTLITVLLWAGFEIWRTFHTSTVTPDIKEAIKPLDPTVNESVFSNIQSRQQVNQ